jgi:hypothetical protein
MEDKNRILEHLLFEGAEPEGLTLNGKKGFFGLEAHIRNPIEQVGIALPAGLFSKYHLLVVDSFQLMNGTNQEMQRAASKSLESRSEQIAKTYDLNFDLVFCSQFFETRRYKAIYDEIKVAVLSNYESIELIRKTIPEGKNKNDFSYAIHEIATTAYMQDAYNVDVKVGQPREKLYDRIIDHLLSYLGFAYINKTYAFGTIYPMEVTPYNPDSGTKNGGRRLLLDELNNDENVEKKLRLGPPEAQRSLQRIALAAGVVLGGKITCDDMRLDVDCIKKAITEYIAKPLEMNKI